MTHLELLDYLREHEEYWTSLRANRWAKVPAFNALRAVVELTSKDIEHESYAWLDGYDYAMKQIIQTIEKELE